MTFLKRSSRRYLEVKEKFSSTAVRWQSTHITTVLTKFDLSNVLLGPTTIIPDANQIHLAKKKREQMRLRNDRDEEEFISLAGGDDTEVWATFWNF